MSRKILKNHIFTKCVFIALLSMCVISSSAFAGKGNTPSPWQQSAAVDDTWAMQSNPAGIGFVDSFQLVAGISALSDFKPFDFNSINPKAAHLLVQSVLTPIDGWSLGFGAQYLTPFAANGVSDLRLTFSEAFQFARVFSIGAQIHLDNRLDPRFGATKMKTFLDIGTQLRPTNWLSFGTSIENLGGIQFADTAQIRSGFSVRPFGKYLTLGSDLLVNMGHPNFFTGDAYANATVSPSVAAKLQGYGLALYLSGSLNQLAFSQAYLSNPNYALNMGIEVNTAHLGLLFSKGYASNNETREGAYLRISAEEFQSVFPKGKKWLSLGLVGDGQLYQYHDNMIDELLSDSPNPMTIIHYLKKLTKDESIEGMMIHVSSLRLGWGRLKELRDALIAVQASGKKIVFHFDGAEDPEMYLASMADQIYLSPAATLMLDGLHMQKTYVKKAMRQFGIEAEAIAAGKYKSAPRMFTAEEPNAEENEVQNALLDVLFKHLVDGIATGRKMPKEKVIAAMKDGGLSPKKAHELGFIDGICYSGEMPKLVSQMLNGGIDVSVESTNFNSNLRRQSWEEKSRIAIIPIQGAITGGKSGGGGLMSGRSAGATDIIAQINKAKKDSNIRAVILRIDSPGGDALASDLIWKAVKELAQEKKVVASMGDVAASGGYYIAAAADEIIAEPGTITGSIGVFALFFNGEKLADNVGVKNYGYHRGSEFNISPMKKLTPEERGVLQKYVDLTYDRFVHIVSLGRGLSEKILKDELAGGRVWTGEEALKHKLVDRLGGIQEAIERVKVLANIPEGEELDLEIMTASGGFGETISGAVHSLSGVSKTENELKRATKLLVGDTPYLFLLENEKKAMLLAPVNLEIK